MEIDHFDPRKKNDPVQDYENLLLASRHCNRAKGDTWPSEVDIANGIYLINPCKERDYGKHFFEDPMTHELVGGSTAGRFHIDVLDLNRDHLIEERRDRAALLRQLTIFRGGLRGPRGLLLKLVLCVLGLLQAGLIAEVEKQVKFAIPTIDVPPNS